MVQLVPPPICTASTTWAAMPATWETTARLMVVLPRSLCLSRNLRSAYLQKALDKLLRGWQVFFERGLNLLGRKDEPATLNRVGP
jgi:hypothetical protein